MLAKRPRLDLAITCQVYIEHLQLKSLNRVFQGAFKCFKIDNTLIDSRDFKIFKASKLLIVVD